MCRLLTGLDQELEREGEDEHMERRDDIFIVRLNFLWLSAVTSKFHLLQKAMETLQKELNLFCICSTVDTVYTCIVSCLVYVLFTLITVPSVSFFVVCLKIVFLLIRVVGIKVNA